MYGISGNGFFLPAAILNFINLQGTLAPHCTYRDSVAVWFGGEILARGRMHARTQACPCVCVHTHKKISSTFLSLEIVKSLCKSHVLK